MNLYGAKLDRNCITCPQRCDIFKTLSESELELVNKNRSEAHFKTGELIIKQGTPSNMIIFVISGLTKIFLEGMDGKDLILSIIKPPQFISGPELYYNKTYSYSATALTNAECCYVNESIFKQLISENRLFSEAFIQEFCRRSINTLSLLVNSTQKKMHGRIANGLLYLSTIFENDSFDMILSKKEFGDLTSMTRESAIRTLHQFKEEGLIDIHGSNIVIKDKEKLQRISHTG